MEQASEWSLLTDTEDDGLISERAAQKVRNAAPAGCLICAIEEGDDEWDA